MSNLSLPGEPILIPLSADVRQSLMGDLARIDDVSKRLDVGISTPPVAGSAAAVELANKSQAYAHHLAAAAVRSALDHLLAWRNLLSAGVMPTYAHMSLLRAAHESTLLAYWLVEPGLDSATRHARGIAAQADDYEQRRKFEGSMGATTPPPKGKLAADRLTDLMATASHLGLTKPNKKGDPVLKTVVPGTVELFDLYEPASAPAKGQWRYRLYSGYAHARQWALVLGAQQVGPFDASGHTIAVSQAQDSVAVDATQKCIDAVDRAISAYEQLRK